MLDTPLTPSIPIRLTSCQNESVRVSLLSSPSMYLIIVLKDCLLNTYLWLF